MLCHGEKDSTYTDKMCHLVHKEKNSHNLLIQQTLAQGSSTEPGTVYSKVSLCEEVRGEGVRSVEYEDVSFSRHY